MNRSKTILLVSLALTAMVIATALGHTISNSFSSGLVTLVDIDPAEIDYYFEDGKLKPEYVEQINKNIDEVPDFVLDTFADGTTNVTLLTDEQEDINLSVVVGEEKLLEAVQGHKENADALVKVNEETLEIIAGSNEPVNEFVQAVQKKEINYEAISGKAKLREIIFGIITFFLGIIMAIFSFFKAIFGG